MNRLRHFRKDEITLPVYDTYVVLKFFFTHTPSKITDDDRAFAQALMVNAIEQTAQMQISQDWFSSFYGNAHKGPQKIFVAFAKSAAKRWIKAKINPDSLEDTEIYEVMKNVVRLRWSTVWQARMNGLKLKY